MFVAIRNKITETTEREKEIEQATELRWLVDLGERERGKLT